MTTGAGPRPWWNGLGFGVAILAVTLFVVLFVPPAPVPDEAPAPTSSTRPGRTITLDELEAMLTDSPGAPPPTVQVETPDGPATVIVPTPQPPPTSTTTTAPPTTTTTTTTVPVSNRPPDRVTDDILDDILGGEATPTTIPEGAGGAP